MDVRRYARFAIPAVVVVLAGAWLYLRFGTSEEERIAKALEKTRRSIESHSILAFIDHISPGYRDQWGNRKDEIKGAAIHVMRTFPLIRVDVVEPEVTVEGDKASVACYARMTVGQDESSLVEIGREFTEGRPVRIEFMKADGEWRISGVFRPQDSR